MLNPFFLQGSATEQGLIRDLINEQLRMYGVEVYYLPRKYITEKTIIKEVIESEFDNAYPIEAYVETYEGYGDNSTILSKFGIQSLNELSLIISRERFKSYISPLIKDQSNIKLHSRPKEGDLIYFPLGDRLFEIKYVEHEKPFYQLQGLYTYQLKCELFRYEDELINTSIEEIDNLSEVADDGTVATYGGYTQTLTLVGAPSTATAIASVFNGSVRIVTMSNRGKNYTSSPTVAFSSAPSGGMTAVGIASMLSGLSDLCQVDKSLSKVQDIQITNPGYGYTVAPKVVFIGGGGSGVAATSTIGNGVVGLVTITSGGSGYAAAPTVSISTAPAGGINASAVAFINNAGVVTSIRMTNGGLGYTQPPVITISGSGSTGIGTYSFNELITGSSSGTTARVKSWNSTTNLLEVSNIDGTFAKGETITGATSGASYKLRTVNTDNPNDEYAQNQQIESEADQIIDFSEVNPFGTV